MQVFVFLPLPGPVSGPYHVAIAELKSSAKQGEKCTNIEENVIRMAVCWRLRAILISTFSIYDLIL